MFRLSDSKLYIHITPNNHLQFSEDDTVRVISDLDELIYLQRNHGGCNEDMAKVIAYLVAIFTKCGLCNCNTCMLKLGHMNMYSKF